VRLGCIDMSARDTFAKKHDIGLEDATTRSARRHRKTRKVRLVQIGVAVRQYRSLEFGLSGVQPDKFILKIGASAFG
jgi:hypothetical protein